MIMNLMEIYVYRPTKVTVRGEPDISWEFIGIENINKQEDINEMDMRTVGDVDVEIIKFRTRDILNINKGDGISFEETTVPQYVVKKKPKIGDTIVYTCTTYNGE